MNAVFDIACFTFTEFQILDEIAFFDNYALLNIRLLLFNSYRMYIFLLCTVFSRFFFSEVAAFSRLLKFT
ncbi:AMP deaminase 2 [Trichinella spiralis]|uniref:AMP deaminase 2 n=1 Tax=Trichinella spiralis TaxID=6334 RepID=UPI0001EFC9A0|nr:AMP deaminase 2 [Trichinella spiralis]